MVLLAVSGGGRCVPTISTGYAALGAGPKFAAGIGHGKTNRSAGCSRSDRIKQVNHVA